MGLFSKLKGEFIDIVEWTDDSNDTLVYRFERYQNELKYGAQLTCREGQAAVFINEGQLADVFKPGRYELQTQNLPILTTLKGWKHGFNSPFKAEVYFVSLKKNQGQKWGTKNPITLNDDRFGMLEIRAFGTYAYRVDDPALFVKEIVGTDGHFTQDEISDQIRSLMVTRFTDAIGEANLPVEAFASQVNELSEIVTEVMAEDFKKYGLKLDQFLVENVSMPEEIKKEIFELSRLEKVDLRKYQQMKTAKATEVAAANENGVAGAGMGMGMGFAMANQMGQAMAPQAQAPAAAPAVAVPPPVPQTLAFHIAINGAQQGPYDLNTLQGMVSQGSFTRDTLVWKQGMAGWVAAGQVPELSNLFGAVPPPVPGA